MLHLKGCNEIKISWVTNQKGQSLWEISKWRVNYPFFIRTMRLDENDQKTTFSPEDEKEMRENEKWKHLMDREFENNRNGKTFHISTEIRSNINKFPVAVQECLLEEFFIEY